MLPLPGTQTRTDGGSLRRAPGCSGAPGRSAPAEAAEAAEGPEVRPGPSRGLPLVLPNPYPQGEEQPMETCDFFHQWTQTHPSRTKTVGGGRAQGGKKLFSALGWVAQVLAPG